MPSRRIFERSVVRAIPSLAAAPFLPPTTHRASSSTCRIWFRVGESYLFGSLSMRGKVQFLGHPDQIRNRFRAHLLHDSRAVSLDGEFAGAEFSTHLFVQE